MHVIRVTQHAFHLQGKVRRYYEAHEVPVHETELASRMSRDEKHSSIPVLLLLESLM